MVRSINTPRNHTVTGERIRSIRGYRRRIDELFKKAANGEISWGNARSGAAMAREAAEMLTAENLLALQGVVDQEVVHELGPDGGLETGIGPITPHKRKKVTVRKGVDKNGNEVDETTVAYESDGEDPALLDVAEITALE